MAVPEESTAQGSPRAPSAENGTDGCPTCERLRAKVMETEAGRDKSAAVDARIYLRRHLALHSGVAAANRASTYRVA